VALSKQETIDKMLSFNYKESADWIRSRLHGDDKYFPVFEGYESNLSKFLTEAFYNIKEERFRNNFLEIMDDLATELWSYTKNDDYIKENQEYIYELLSLCGRIGEFKRKSMLYRIALSGKLKGFYAFDKDLHLMLLRALASYSVAGDCEFWIDQMKDDSNKYYANAAFYALLNGKYDPDVLFDHMDIFIDRFQGEIDLILGIKALMNDYDPREIFKRFKGIDDRLTPVQKDAVNNVFSEMKYSKPYKISPKIAREREKVVYAPLKPVVSMVGEEKVTYVAAKTLPGKAGEIFKRMGFDIEMNREIAGHAIDLLIKKKKSFGDKYECYVCKCVEGKRKVEKNEIDVFLAVREAVSREGCDAIIIAEKGFTKNALKLASEKGIILKTLEELERIFL